jgi:hypothetical protein
MPRRPSSGRHPKPYPEAEVTHTRVGLTCVTGKRTIVANDVIVSGIIKN